MKKTFIQFLLKTSISMIMILSALSTYANDPITLNIYAFVYIPTTPFSPITFNFSRTGAIEPVTTENPGAWASQDIDGTATLTVSQSGVNCVSMGSLKSDPWPNPHATTSDIHRLNTQ